MIQLLFKEVLFRMKKELPQLKHGDEYVQGFALLRLLHHLFETIKNGLIVLLKSLVTAIGLKNGLDGFLVNKRIWSSNEIRQKEDVKDRCVILGFKSMYGLLV